MTGKNRKKTPSKKHSQPASSRNDSQGSEQGSVDTVDLIGTDPKYDINSSEVRRSKTEVIMTKKNMKTLSKKSSSSSIDSGELPSKKSSSSSIDSGELAAENPLYDVTTDDFGSKFTELVTSLAHNQKTPSKKSSSSSTDSKYSGEPAADDSIYGVNTNDFDSKFMALYRTNSNSVIIEAKNMATFEENYLLTTDSKRRRFRIGKLRMGVVSKELNRNIDPTIDDEKIWSKMNSFQRLAMRYLRKEWLENGGAGAEEVVEDRRPSQAPSSAPPSQLQHSTRTNDEPHASRRQPRTRTNNKPPASQTQPRTRVDIVELPEPRPLAPLAMGGMTQAQIDTMMATLQTQSEVLKRTQEQQAASNAQIMHMQSSMAFLADTMKKFQDKSNNEQSDEENDEDGELSNMESCD